MKVASILIMLFLYGSLPAQDKWKNVYSQHAWAERDKWQKADALIGMLKISEGDAVADIGCHEGYMTFKLAKVVGGSGKVYAVDVVDFKLQKVTKRAAKNNLDQITVIKGDVDNPKLPANALDAVIILDTYHEMDDHDEILRHVKLSLKRGGRLLICEAISDERRTRSRADQEQSHELSMDFALADLRKAGYRIAFERDNFIDRTKEKGDRMWVVVAVKD